MSKDEYTLHGVAVAIARRNTPEEISLIKRRVRNWTVNGLLEPIGGQEIGSGKHRRYDRREVFAAAVFNLFSDYLRSDKSLLKNLRRTVDFMSVDPPEEDESATLTMRLSQELAVTLDVKALVRRVFG